jgi:hypothetical protein
MLMAVSPYESPAPEMAACEMAACEMAASEMAACAVTGEASVTSDGTGVSDAGGRGEGCEQGSMGRASWPQA